MPRDPPPPTGREVSRTPMRAVGEEGPPGPLWGYRGGTPGPLGGVPQDPYGAVGVVPQVPL